jgi:hypothetical protein
VLRCLKVTDTHNLRSTQLLTLFFLDDYANMSLKFRTLEICNNKLAFDIIFSTSILKKILKMDQLDNDDNVLRTILESTKTIALVGASNVSRTLVHAATYPVVLTINSYTEAESTIIRSHGGASELRV